MDLDRDPGIGETFKSPFAVAVASGLIGDVSLEGGKTIGSHIDPRPDQIVVGAATRKGLGSSSERRMLKA